MRVSPTPCLASEALALGLPGCKSHAQRALLLAAFVDGTSRLQVSDAGADFHHLAQTLAANGREIVADGRDGYSVAGRALQRGERLRCHVGESGTAARMLLMLVPMLGGILELDGEPSLRARPMLDAVAALRMLGVAVDGDCLPLLADGSRVVHEPRWSVDASRTTQPASGLLLAAALRGFGQVRARGAKATGYLELTAAVLRQWGSQVHGQADDLGWHAVVSGAVASREFQVPLDASSRAFPVALAALRGIHLPAALHAAQFAPHPDLQIDGDLRRLLDPATNEVVLADLAQRPDVVPMLAAVAACRTIPVRMRFLANLRLKESDRLQAMQQALRQLGARASVQGDDLLVQGPLRSGQHALSGLPSDHRIIMALAVLGAVRQEGLVLPHPQCCAKSWPGFWNWLAGCAQVVAEP